MTVARRLAAPAFAALMISGLGACAVVTVASTAVGVAGAAAGAAVTVVGTGVKVAGKVVEKTIDAVTPSPAAASPAPK